MTKVKGQSLHKQSNPLADATHQLKILAEGPFKNGDLPLFKERIHQSLGQPLVAKKLEILQINVGYMCNQVCDHCHVDAGPDRKEIMTRATMEQCLEIGRAHV